MKQQTIGAVSALDIRHKFETAGLGIGPFRCVDFYECKYQACQGAPVQPGTSCDYCGTGIMYVFVIEDRNKKRFKVGSDCVLKTGDAGLVNYTKRAMNRVRREAQLVRENVRIAAAKEVLKRDDIRAQLAAKPHPFKWHADQGKTLLDYYQYLLMNGGQTGRMDVTKVIEKMATPEREGTA